LKKIILVFFILFINTHFKVAYGENIDPRLKAVGTMAAYGTIGGVLLGTATLAFDSSPRSPFIGASLGLYAGIIFGGYVVGTHYVGKRSPNPTEEDAEYYPETSDSPYESPFSNPFSSGQDEDDKEDNRPDMLQRWDPTWGRNHNGRKWNRSRKYKNDVPLFYLPLLNMNF